MKNLLNKLNLESDTALMAASLLLLLCAVLFNPTINIKHDVRSYFLVVDISQSMNVEDTKLNGVAVSRLAYTREMLHEIVGRMPCGTNIGIGLFAGSSVAALYEPLEVCTHYSVIHGTISHLDWKNAWSANSRIRESLGQLSSLTRSFPEHVTPVYFTDGEEAPKLHVFNTKDLKNFQGGRGWLFVGIGGLDGAPIPKYTDTNQRIGYWSNESFAMQPGISQISEGNLGARDERIASSDTDRYLSKLDEKYLQSLADEIQATYLRGDNVQDVFEGMQRQRSQKLTQAPFSLNPILASLAGMLVVATFIPKNAGALIIKKLNKKKTKKSVPIEFTYHEHSD